MNLVIDMDGAVWIATEEPLWWCYNVIELETLKERAFIASKRFVW